MGAMLEFLHMGGYAFFVWMSYGVTAIVLVANWIIPMRRGHRLRAELARNAGRTASGPTKVQQQ